MQEYSDSMLVSYLATITKSSNAIHEVSEKVSVAFDSNRRRK
jgi:hypothetical protein